MFAGFGRRMAGGALLGGLIGGGIDRADGTSGGVAQGAMIGAALGAGRNAWRLGKSGWKAAGSSMAGAGKYARVNAKLGIRKMNSWMDSIPAGAKNAIDNMSDTGAMGINALTGNKMTMKGLKGLSAGLSGAIPGAGVGAIAGALYGAADGTWSGNESMLSGAFKGALGGAAIGAAARGISYTNILNKIPATHNKTAAKAADSVRIKTRVPSVNRRNRGGKSRAATRNRKRVQGQIRNNIDAGKYDYNYNRKYFHNTTPERFNPHPNVWRQDINRNSVINGGYAGLVTGSRPHGNRKHFFNS